MLNLKNIWKKPVLLYAHSYFRLGVIFAERGELKKAIAAYRKAIELNPNYDCAYNNLGVALRRQGKLDDAIAAYRKAIELDPNDAFPYNNLGVALRRQGKLDDAIAAYRKAIELRGLIRVKAYNNMGIALTQQGKLDDAIAAYHEAIKLKDAYYPYPYANKNQRLDYQWELIGAYRKAIELDPKFASAYYHLGKALYNENEHEEAITAYRKAIELDPLDPSYAYLRSLRRDALNVLGKKEEAIAADLNRYIHDRYEYGSSVAAYNNLWYVLYYDHSPYHLAEVEEEAIYVPTSSPIESAAFPLIPLISLIPTIISGGILGLLLMVIIIIIGNTAFSISIWDKIGTVSKAG